MKTKITLILSFMLIALVSSCKKDTTESPEIITDSEDDVKSTTITPNMGYTIGEKDVDFCGTPLETTFRDYGKVSIFNDVDSVYIKIALSNGKLLKSAYIYYDDLRNVPIGTKGVPQYKAFPNVCRLARPLPTLITFSLPKNRIQCNAFFIKLATIEIVNDTTFIKDSWFVNGTQFKSTPVTYNNYCNQKCCTINPKESYSLYGFENKVVGDITILNNNNDSAYITFNLTADLFLKSFQFTVVDKTNNKTIKFVYVSPVLPDGIKKFTYAVAKSSLGFIDDIIVFKAEGYTYYIDSKGKKINTHKAFTINKITGIGECNEYSPLICR
jgi:hypothetical protein